MLKYNLLNNLHLLVVIINIFLNARKSVFYHYNGVWEKQTGLFDITMGAFDGAQMTDYLY